MMRLMLSFLILFQAGSQTALTPILENERVVVWDVTDSTGTHPLDSVVIAISGNAVFAPKGSTSKIAGRTIVIDLKDHPVAPIQNTSGYPLAFPRPGIKKILENDRVIVWDYTWTPGMPTPMHFHDKDVVVLFSKTATSNPPRPTDNLPSTRTRR